MQGFMNPFPFGHYFITNHPRTGVGTPYLAESATGMNLGSGADITNVTLCGTPAAGIVTQSSTQVVVTAGVHVLNPGQAVKFYVEPGTPAAASAASATRVSVK